MYLLSLEAWAVFLLHYRSNFLLRHWQKQRLYISWKNISGTWDHVYLRHPRSSVDPYPWSILSNNTWQHSIGSWSIPSRHSIWPLVDTRSTSWLTHMGRLTFSRLSSVTVRLTFPFYWYAEYRIRKVWHLCFALI